MKPEFQELLAKAKTALDEARVLAQAGHHAGAVSRAYYAMFYSASAMLQSQGVVVKTHPGTIGKFGELFAKSGLTDRKLGRWLNEAFELRMDADYTVEGPPFMTVETAQGQLERADEFVATAEEYLKKVG